MGLWGLYGFAFGLWFHRGVARVGIVLMLLALLLSSNHLCRFAKVPLVRVVALWLIFLGCRFLLVLPAHPELARLHGEGVLRMAYLAGFLLVAFHIEGQAYRIVNVLLLAVTGFFLGRLLYLNEITQQGWDFWRFRHELGFPTAIALGQYAATVILTLLILRRRLFNRWRHWGVRTAWGLGLALALECLVLSQSRSAWVALLAVILFVPVLARWAGMPCRRLGLQGIGWLVVLGIAVGLSQYRVIAERLSQEGQVYLQLFRGQMDAIPMQQPDGREYSIGVRVAMWRFGIGHWLEKPWFGWGPGATGALIACCAPEVFKRFNDLHSAPVELLLRLGLTGLSLAAVIVLMVVWQLIRALRKKQIETDLFLSVLAALLLHVVLSLVNFRLLNYDWRFFWFLYGGIAASFAFAVRNGNETEQDR